MKLDNKKILVTGGSGFLGGHVIEKLKKYPAILLSPRHRDLDLTIEKECDEYFFQNRPNIIIHCAGAISGLLNILEEPADIFENNLRINLNVLKYSQKYHIEKLVNIGSTCAYPGELPTGYFREEEFLNGPMHESVESYGFSKRAMYIGSKAYRQQYNLNGITLLLTNMYGPNDVFNIKRSHVVSALINKFVTAKRNNLPTVEVLGSGSAIREFIYVEDAADAIIESAKQYSEEMPLNIGTGVETPIAELAELIKTISSYVGKIVWNIKGPDGAIRKVSDISRAQTKLDWNPKFDLKAGLEKTIRWFENNYEVAVAKK